MPSYDIMHTLIKGTIVGPGIRIFSNFRKKNLNEALYPQSVLSSIIQIV